MSVLQRKQLRTLSGLGMSMAGLVAFALCVGEAVGWIGLGVVVASLWVT